MSDAKTRAADLSRKFLGSAFESLSSHLVPSPDSSGVPSPLQRFATLWQSMSDEERRTVVNDLAAGTAAAVARIPALASARKSIRRTVKPKPVSAAPEATGKDEGGKAGSKAEGVEGRGGTGESPDEKGKKKHKKGKKGNDKKSRKDKKDKKHRKHGKHKDKTGKRKKK